MLRNFIITIFLISAVSTNSLSQNSNGAFKISGTVSGDYSEYVYLIYGKKQDSSLVENGSYSFKGKVDYPLEARIVTKNGIAADIFYIENNDIKINILIAENKIYIDSITGNKTALILRDLQDFYERNRAKPDFSSALISKLDTIITNYPKSQFSGVILGDVILDPIFNYEQASSLYAKLDLSTQDKETIESIENSLLKLKTIRLGTIIKDFELPNVQGKLINTSHFKKRFLLLEFWASWCIPCRKNNPELVEIYKKYNKKGFEIYGISICFKRILDYSN